MPAKSKAPRKAASAALSAKRGQTKPGALKGASRQMFETMNERELDSLAATKRKGLPQHVQDDLAADDTPAKRSAARAVKSRPRTATKDTSQGRTKKAAKKMKRNAPPKRAPARKRQSQ